MRLIPGGRFRKSSDEAHQALLIRPNIVAETTSVLQLAAIVKAGHTAAILPTTVNSSFGGSSVKQIPLSGFLNYSRDLVLAYSRSHTKRRAWTKQQLSIPGSTFQTQLSS